MVRFLINLIILMFVISLIRPLFRSIQRGYRNLFGPKPKRRPVQKQKKGYKDLSPYDIEDGEYEEVGKKSG